MAKHFNLVNRATTISKNPNVLRGLIRSMSQAGTEVIKDYVPAGDAIIKSNKQTVDTFKKIKLKPVSISDVKKGMIYKTSKQFIENALEDLKSGNLYNEERAKDAEKSMLEGFFGFGNGELDSLINDYNDGNDVEWSNTEETKESKANIDIRNTTTTNVIMKNSNIKPIINSLATLTKNVIDSNSKGFAVIDSKLTAIVNFNNNVKVEFYNNLSSELANITGNIGKLTNAMEQLSRLEAGGLETSNNFNQLSTILDSTELLSLKYYTDKLGRGNKKETEKLLSPIVAGLKAGMKAVMPEVMKDALAEFNELLKAVPTMLNQKFKDMRNSDNGIASTLGELFYKDSKATRSYEKGPVAFDGITRRSIVNVIPSLLSKILNSIKKGKAGDELVYDYEAGGFRTAGDIRKASFKQSQMYSTRELSDENSAAYKMLSGIVGKQGVTRKEKEMVEKAIRKMVMTKEIPRKGVKFSKNAKVNQLIMESWLNMSPADKADFVRIISYAKSPEEFLLDNESFHNVDNIFGFDDLFKSDKRDPDLKKAVQEYLYGKGYNKLAASLSDGDAHRRNQNNLSKMNPLYYVVEGIRKGNDLMAYIMFGGDDDKYIGPNSLFGRVRRRSSQLFNDIVKSPMDEIKRRMAEDRRNRELNEELSDIGFGDTVSSFFKTIFDITKGTLKEGTASIRSTIHEKFLDPVLNMLKEHVVNPLKQGLSSVGTYIGKFFNAITGPFRRAFQTRRNIINQENANNPKIEPPEAPKGIETESSADVVKDMRQNEVNAEGSLGSNIKSITKMGKLEKLVITKNTEILVAVRQNITKPLEKLSKAIIDTANIGTVYDQAGFEMVRIKDSQRVIKNIETNIGKLSDKGNKKAGQIQELMDKYGVTKEEAEELIKDIKNRRKTSNGNGESLEDIEEREPNQEAIDELNALHARYESKIDKIHRKYDKKQAKKEYKYQKRIEKAKGKIGNVVGTFKETFGIALDTTLGTVSSIASIVANTAKGLFDGVTEFVTSSLPKLFKTTFGTVKDVAKTTISELKDFGKTAWDEFKNQASKIMGLAGSIFSGSLTRLTDFFSRIRQKRINVYVTGGYLDGVRDPIKVIKTKRKGYDYMKNQFNAEDAEDAADNKDVDDSSSGIRKTITQKFKEKTKFITDFLKSTVGAAFKGIASTIGSGLSMAGGMVLGKFGGTVIGKMFNGIGTMAHKLGDKLSQRKSKGAKVIGKILGAGGEAAEMGDATPVYVVGGTLDVNGGGLLGGGDSAADTVLDEVGDVVEEKVGNKILKRLSNSKVGKKFLGSKFGGKIAGWLGKGAVETAGEAAVETAANAAGKVGMFTKVKNVFSAMKGAKGVSGMFNAAKAAMAGGEAAAAAGAAGAGGAAAAGAGGILATGGAILAPLAMMWLTDRAFKGIGGWFSAGEHFGTDDPTIGMRAASALGTFLDGLLPGDQSSWINGIYGFGSKVKDSVKNFVGGAKNMLTSLWPFGKDKNMEKSIMDSTNPDTIQSNLLQGNSSILSSLLTVTSPMTALTYEQLRNYKNYKSKESDLETKFLAKLTTAEREDYIANKNASLFGTMLRTQDSGKLVKTIMGTSLLASMGGGGIGSVALSKLIEQITKNVGNNGNGNQNNEKYTTGGSDLVIDDNNYLGQITAKYEVGGQQAITASKAGDQVSSNKGNWDRGGVSYGIPQFASTTGSAAAFVSSLKSSGSKFASFFEGAGSPGSSSFTDAWHKASASDSIGFATEQIKHMVSDKGFFKYLYDDSLKNLNLNWCRSRAMQEAGFAMSAALGGGGAAKMAKGAGISPSMDDKTLLTKLYDHRNAMIPQTYKSYGEGVRNAWRRRLKLELADLEPFMGQPAINLSAYGYTMPGGNATNTTGNNGTSTASSYSLMTTSAKKADTNYESVNETINAINGSTMGNTDPTVALMREALILLTKITDNTKEVADKNIVEEYTETTKDENNKVINQTGKTSVVGMNKFERRMNKILAGIS